MAIMRSPARTKYIQFPGQFCMKIVGRSSVWYTQGAGFPSWQCVTRKEAADILRGLRRALRTVNAVRECAGVTRG